MARWAAGAAALSVVVYGLSHGRAPGATLQGGNEVNRSTQPFSESACDSGTLLT